MLNPKIREFYDENICIALEKVSQFFENLDEVVYITGITGTKVGLHAPTGIMYDNKDIKDEAEILLDSCYESYTKDLTAEEEEKVYSISNSYSKEFWYDLYVEEDLIPLWVK